MAVGLAILDRTRLTARPQLHVLGRIPGTTSWAPVTAPAAAHGGARRARRSCSRLPLWYANATHFRAALDHVRRRSAQAPRLVVLDALGMYDLDFTGSQALSQALDELGQDGITFAVARAGDHLKKNLARAGLLERIGADHFYASVDEAVTTARFATTLSVQSALRMPDSEQSGSPS